jgi:hypothetical protein
MSGAIPSKRQVITLRDRQSGCAALILNDPRSAIANQVDNLK